MDFEKKSPIQEDPKQTGILSKIGSKARNLTQAGRLALMDSLEKEYNGVNIALEILQELDYEGIGGQELDRICELIEEFHFNEKIISFLKLQGIEVFHFKPPIKMEANIILKRKKTEKTSNIHFQNGITVALNRILVNGVYNQDTLEYYSGFNISGKNSLLIFNRNEECTFGTIADIEEINGLQVSLIESLENIDWERRDNFSSSMHLYIEAWNEIIPLGFVDYGMGIPGEDQDDDSNSKSGSEVMVFFLDEDKTAFLTFDGEGFSPLKQVKYSKLGIGENIRRLI